jgi:hypothetical protein
MILSFVIVIKLITKPENNSIIKFAPFSAPPSNWQVISNFYIQHLSSNIIFELQIAQNNMRIWNVAFVFSLITLISIPIYLIGYKFVSNLHTQTHPTIAPAVTAQKLHQIPTNSHKNRNNLDNGFQGWKTLGWLHITIYEFGVKIPLKSSPTFR